MWRIALSALMAAHGLVHVFGFASAWQLVQSDELPSTDSILAGKVHLSQPASRALGLGWLVLAVGFLVAAVALGIHAPAWWSLAVACSAVSLVMCTLGLTETWFGLVLNVALLALLLGISEIRELATT